MSELPQWLLPDWTSLFARHTDQKLPHALLIEGVAGIGKTLFAEHAARTLLCSNNEAGVPCGLCTSCLLLEAGNHPDINRLTPLADESVIKVDAVRGLIDWLLLTPQYDSYKVAIISPAHAMNRNAANSLLKTLEEPASQDLIILTSESAGYLPATIRSRCQRMVLSVRDQSAAIAWLAEQNVSSPGAALSAAGGGPLLAAQYVQGDLVENRQRLFKVWHDILLNQASIARCVESVADLPTKECLQTFSGWVADIVRLRADPEAPIRYADARVSLIPLANCMNDEAWFTLYDQLLILNRTDSASFKTQTVLEGIFAAIRLR